MKNANKSTSDEKRTEGVRLLRVLNEQMVLDAILRHGSITRPDIAEKTGLSLPTVVSRVDSLEQMGLVRKNGIFSGSVGRPANLYSVDARVGYVFAVDLGGSKLHAGIADLFGNVIAEQVEPTHSESTDSLLKQLDDLHQKLLMDADLESTATGVASIGVPGVWQPDTDLIDAAYNLPILNNIPLKATIQKTLNLPVIIENDVNLAAVGEASQRQISNKDTLVAFFVGTGIGMGIIINGEIYRGKSGAAGEIGLLPIGANPYAPELRDGGAFEVAAAGPSINKRVQKALSNGSNTNLPGDANMEDIVHSVDTGDEVAISILNDEARTLAIGVAAIVTVLDPNIVILGGGVGSHEKLAEQVHQYASELVPWMPPIEVSGLGNRSPFIGAVALGLPLARDEILSNNRED